MMENSLRQLCLRHVTFIRSANDMGKVRLTDLAQLCNILKFSLAIQER